MTRTRSTGRRVLEGLQAIGGLGGSRSGPAPRLGLIGTGRHCRSNLLPALSLVDATLVAASARHREHAEAIGRRHGATSYYDDYRRMLEAESLDGVIACIDAETHPAVIRSALEAGVAVFVEKPVARSSAEVEALTSLSGSERVQVGFQKRFAPSYQTLRDAIAKGRYGRLHTLHLELGVGAFAGPASEFLLEVGIHFVDLLRYLLPDARLISVHPATDAQGRFNRVATFESSSGTIATLLLSSTFDWSNSHERVLANFERLTFQVENLVDQSTQPTPRATGGVPWERFTRRRRFERRWRPNYVTGALENSSVTQAGFLPELQAFVSGIGATAPRNPSGLDNALETHRLLEQLDGL